jgi:hypothetical protein
MFTFLRALPFFALAVLFAACATDDRTVVSIPLHTPIETIYVVNNPAVSAENDNLQPAIVGQLSAMGFLPIIVDSAEVAPQDYILTYSARMAGHSVRTMIYLSIEVRKDGRNVGYAFSDASTSADKFGSTEDRVRPLMNGIFQYVRRDGIRR